MSGHYQDVEQKSSDTAFSLKIAYALQNCILFTVGKDKISYNLQTLKFHLFVMTTHINKPFISDFDILQSKQLSYYNPNKSHTLSIGNMYIFHQTCIILVVVRHFSDLHHRVRYVPANLLQGHLQFIIMILMITFVFYIETLRQISKFVCLRSSVLPISQKKFIFESKRLTVSQFLFSFLKDQRLSAAIFEIILL